MVVGVDWGVSMQCDYETDRPRWKRRIQHLSPFRVWQKRRESNCKVRFAGFRPAGVAGKIIPIGEG